MEPVKTAVLDFHVQIEGQLEDIINLAFRDPTAYKTDRLGFSRKVGLVRALIGKTPDDEREYADEILEQVRKILPTFGPTPELDRGKQLQILAQALFVVRRFFREIKAGIALAQCHA